MKSRPGSEKVLKLHRQRNVAHQEFRRSAQASYTATEAKNEFGRVLDQAIQGTTVLITKHDSPRAVLISMDQYKALEEAHQLKLNTLTEHFDTLLERMQTPQARRGMTAAFGANSKQLGDAAVVAVRKRGAATQSNTRNRKSGKSAGAADRKRA